MYLRLRKVLAPLTFVSKDNNLFFRIVKLCYLNFYFFLFFWGRQKRGFCSYVPSIEEEIRPSLKCQRLALVMGGVEKLLMKEALGMTWFISLLICKWYNPCFNLAKPIIFKDFISYIWQWELEKVREYFSEDKSLEIEIRLNLKFGT